MVKQCINCRRNIVGTTQARITHYRGATARLIGTAWSSLLNPTTSVGTIPSMLGSKLVPKFMSNKVDIEEIPLGTSRTGHTLGLTPLSADNSQTG